MDIFHNGIGMPFALSVIRLSLFSATLFGTPLRGKNMQQLISKVPNRPVKATVEEGGMLEIDKLSYLLLERPIAISEKKKRGIKVIATNVGDYVPHELIHAAGGVPVCQIHGGDPESVEAAHSVVVRFQCAFARAQMGYRLLQDQAYYNLADMLIVATTCQHMRKFADIWEYHTDVETWRLGLPQEFQTDRGMAYYTDALRRMKEKLEQVTGNRITDERITESITIYNRMRGLLRKISEMRQSSSPMISSLEFMKLNHASFLLDPEVMVESLTLICQTLEKNQQENHNGKPRLMLVAPNIALGDYKIFGLVDESGGEIVIEEVGEGVRAYWENVISNGGDPLEALAFKYLRKRCPACFMRQSMKSRLDHITRLAEDFGVKGVIWYQLKLCETFDIEFAYVAKQLKNYGLPILKLDTEYNALDRGQMKTRIGDFMESLGRSFS
jgi:benzoyl-CoA reductase/2-hydroxyglutaryl-CoA dehydratase subunit BcrC/BadD/HgdB